MRIFVANQFHAHSSIYPLVWMYSRSQLTSNSFCGTTIVRWPCMVVLEHGHQNYWQQYLHMEHMTGFLRKGHCLSCHASVSVSGTYVHCTIGRTGQVLSRTLLCLGSNCFPATSDRNFTWTSVCASSCYHVMQELGQMSEKALSQVAEAIIHATQHTRRQPSASAALRAQETSGEAAQHHVL